MEYSEDTGLDKATGARRAGCALLGAFVAIRPGAVVAGATHFDEFFGREVAAADIGWRRRGETRLAATPVAVGKSDRVRPCGAKRPHALRL